MTSIEIPKNADFNSIAALIANAEVDVAHTLAETLELVVTPYSFLKVDGLAYLTAWCLELQRNGCEIKISGDRSNIRYLERMGFHHHLQLIHKGLNESPEVGRFIPISLIKTGEDVVSTVDQICELVIRQFKDGVKFLPAMEWAVNELIDNIAIHAESPIPGVVCAQSYPQMNRLEISICDMGRGIRGSLETTREIESDEEALTQALTRGITRDKSVGQGNGMAGAHEICRVNGGSFNLWSGSALYRMRASGDSQFTSEISPVKGTGLCLVMNTEKPVDLQSTWIAGGDWSYIDASAQRLEEAGGMNVAKECANTGSRPPAKYLRRKIEAILPEMEEVFSLDFSDVKSASSSFLDELLGRLSAKFGTDIFKEKVKLTGMTETVRKMANVVIAQRARETTMDDLNEKTLPKEEPDLSKVLQANAWLMKTGLESLTDVFSIDLPYTGALFEGVNNIRGEIFILLSEDLRVLGFARLYRKRIGDDNTEFLFDRIEVLETPCELSAVGMTDAKELGVVSRILWPDFENIYKLVTGKDYDELTEIIAKSLVAQNYLRQLLQYGVKDDLLGPAGGPDEEIVGMSVRDRYLVGKLAPQGRGSEAAERGSDGVERGFSEQSDEDENDDNLVSLENPDHIPNSKKGSYNLAAKGEDEDNQEDRLENQSIVPSSLGFTFCVGGDVEEIDLDVRWGRYHRGPSKTEVSDKTDKPLQVWLREVAGGQSKLRLVDGVIEAFAPDVRSPDVLVRGVIRPKMPNGDKLITLFLVNDQLKPEKTQDTAWVFQPEIIVRGIDDEPVFRRRPVLESDGTDEERDSLEMVYRKRVEFAVGHGISIHAKTPDGHPEQAYEVRTVVMPDYEVAVTETPGIDPTDRKMMQNLVQSGAFDMERLAELEHGELAKVLRQFIDDYSAWISEQRVRIPGEFIEHTDAANEAMLRCDQILGRLREGIEVLESNSDALEAFRFANRAMASQRVHSMYALSQRRGEDTDVDSFNITKNRSWRPFQLAFMLLSIPSLTDPTHKDRTDSISADADLLWFPTGGGKTEAYLGVAAFTMGIRRLQKKFGGLDSSRGLAVIMRYTLRLLTIQQFQRATALICAMEVIRKADVEKLGKHSFSLGLWVGNKVTPGNTERSHQAIQTERDGGRPGGSETPAQLTFCPWCGSDIVPGRDIHVDRDQGRTSIFCGDKLSKCHFSRARSEGLGLPVVVVDEEIYHRPPSMLIGTVDKFAMMAWRGQSRNLFGTANRECLRHGLLWPESDCSGQHPRKGALPAIKSLTISPMRPPDLIIQDEFHLISGPLGTMVGLYETAVDKLCTWEYEGHQVRPKVIASTATVRKATEQVHNVFLRDVAVFPPNGLDIEDNFFSVQRPIAEKPGRLYMGICSPGSSRPAVLIRLYVALLTASQSLYDHFGAAADPYMTLVGYFNSLRELGGMRRLAEDDVQTRAYRVEMSKVNRPGLKQRSVRVVDELTSRVSSKLIPQKLDQLEVKYKKTWAKGETRSIDVVLATNMLSVGVDVNRLGLMAMNGQPKSTAEYIQATSRVGRAYLGLVCTVLTWSRPRDLSHYETFEHYHATFYKHVEAQSVTPFAPRAMDRGISGAFTGLVRLSDETLNPNIGAMELLTPAHTEVQKQKKAVVDRAWKVTNEPTVRDRADGMISDFVDEWVNEATYPGRKLGYEVKGNSGDLAALLKKPGIHRWDKFTVPMSMREVEPGIKLIMDKSKLVGLNDPNWSAPISKKEEGSSNG